MTHPGSDSGQIKSIFGPQGQEAGTPWPGANHCDGCAGGGQGLSPGPAAGVCSQPGSSRHLGTCQTLVCSCLQPPQPQPMGGTADSQHLQAESQGDLEEL